MTLHPEVSVVIPCRNEAGTVGSCVRDALAALHESGYQGEVVVCDNGSTDDSVRVAREAGARVAHQPIRGYGAACLGGMSAAKGRILVLVDGDGTYDLSLLPRFVEPLRAGYDMVLGTRRNGEMAPRSMRRRHRHFLEPVQTALSRRFFNFRISDIREHIGFFPVGKVGQQIGLGGEGCLRRDLPYDFIAQQMVLANAVILPAEIPPQGAAIGGDQRRRHQESAYKHSSVLPMDYPTYWGKLLASRDQIFGSVYSSDEGERIDIRRIMKTQ